MASISLDELHTRISNEYEAGPYSGYGLGWRFLYSPARTLSESDVVFLGFNPGGRERDENHAVFSSEEGSAYRLESWKGRPPGGERLQQQVLALFAMLNLDADSVLAGNLVPFRSPSVNAMPDRKRALQFGRDLWSEILTDLKPRLVVTMGEDAFRAVTPGPIWESKTTHSAGWGNVRIRCAEGGGTHYVGLPHLSRFSILSRPESEAGLQKAFSGYLDASRTG